LARSSWSKSCFAQKKDGRRENSQITIGTCNLTGSERKRKPPGTELVGEIKKREKQEIMEGGRGGVPEKKDPREKIEVGEGASGRVLALAENKKAEKHCEMLARGKRGGKKTPTVTS